MEKYISYKSLEQFKPFLKTLIKYYYNNLDNGCGGYLHIVLDDGNIEHSNISWCKEECEKNNDSFGVFLSDLLLCFTEDELYDMYENNYWGLDE